MNGKECIQWNSDEIEVSEIVGLSGTGNINSKCPHHRCCPRHSCCCHHRCCWARQARRARRARRRAWRAKSRPSASRAPRAPLLTPMLGPGPQARKWLPGPKILIFSKSLQEPLGGSGDPPGAARGCRELPGASGGFREPPGPISGSGKVPEKIKSGLNRHLSQQLAAILIPRAPVVPPGLWTRKNK